MKKEWQPSPELIEELGLDPDDYNPNTLGFRVMGSFDDPSPKRKRFAMWLRADNPEPMSFPDTGALMNWVATDLDDEELNELFREIHAVMQTIWVIGTPNQHEDWTTREADGTYIVVFRTLNPSVAAE